MNKALQSLREKKQAMGCDSSEHKVKVLSVCRPSKPT